MAASGCLHVSQLLVNKVSGDHVLQVLGNKARKKMPNPPVFTHFRWGALLFSTGIGSPVRICCFSLTKQYKGREKKNNKLNFLWPKWPVWSLFLTPKIPSKRFMWVPFLRSFPGDEAHKLFGAPEVGVLGGGQKKFMLKKCMCVFPCPTNGRRKVTPDGGPQMGACLILSEASIAADRCQISELI